MLRFFHDFFKNSRRIPDFSENCAESSKIIVSDLFGRYFSMRLQKGYLRGFEVSGDILTLPYSNWCQNHHFVAFLTIWCQALLDKILRRDNSILPWPFQANSGIRQFS